MDRPDFIEEFPDALPAAECAALVARFEASGQASPGITAAGVQPDLKDSADIQIAGRPEWRDAEERLNKAMFAGLLRYARRYPQLLLSSLDLRWPDADGRPRRMRPEDIAGFDDRVLGGVLVSVLRPGAINLQRYRADSGGYPAWHCEVGPVDLRSEYLHRVLLWTIYLNEGFEEGETEFLFQHRKVRPTTGRLLIAPTAFTHTHRGNRPGGRDKYIATSWVLFKRAEQFAGAPA